MKKVFNWLSAKEYRHNEHWKMLSISRYFFAITLFLSISLFIFVSCNNTNVEQSEVNVNDTTICDTSLCDTVLVDSCDIDSLSVTIIEKLVYIDSVLQEVIVTEYNWNVEDTIERKLEAIDYEVLTTDVE